MKFNFSTFKTLITFAFFVSLFSCGNNPLEVDVSDISIPLEVKRFDQAIFTANTKSNGTQFLKSSYPVFFNDFTNNIISIGNIESEEAQFHLNAFTSDPFILETKKKSDSLYLDFSTYQKELETTFKYYQYYFPKKNIPKIITYISGYNYAIVTSDNYLGIGLDMFLGSKHEAYTRLGLPAYKSDFMNKENLVPGAVLGWVSTEFEAPKANADLLTEMVHQGKILYLLDALMPNTPGTLKINYAAEELNWCNANSEPIWFYLIDNDLLYTKKTSTIIKFMGESPFIQGFPEGSPGRIGHWVGWQIVKAYMKKNPEVSISQLMTEDNAQNILQKSKYKP